MQLQVKDHQMEINDSPQIRCVNFSCVSLLGTIKANELLTGNTKDKASLEEEEGESLWAFPCLHLSFR